MKGAKGKQCLFFVLSMLIFTLSACAPGPDFELYGGESLNIAVIGEPPEVKEEQVSFTEMSFDDLAADEWESYDAVLVTKENLAEGAESQYADIYMNATIPFFFMAAKAHVPFTVKDIAYEADWDWSPGNSYAVGVLASQEDDSLNYFGFGLYNDEKTDEHIKNVYSRIFEKVGELDR